MTIYIEGFSRFVTSTAAPIATGWSESYRMGFSPIERSCLFTAHMIKDVIIHYIGIPEEAMSGAEPHFMDFPIDRRRSTPPAWKRAAVLNNLPNIEIHGM